MIGDEVKECDMVVVVKGDGQKPSNCLSGAVIFRCFLLMREPGMYWAVFYLCIQCAVPKQHLLFIQHHARNTTR
jgi:hypothetical protein